MKHINPFVHYFLMGMGAFFFIVIITIVISVIGSHLKTNTKGENTVTTSGQVSQYQ